MMGIALGKLALIGVLIAGVSLPRAAQAETITVAVAANFTQIAEQLAPLFAAETGYEVVYSFGSTGQLYAQISQGAPFAVFLAADDVRPARAISEGFGVEGTAFTYAVGALALYSTVLDVTDGEAVLTAGDFQSIALADPQSAPYGRAAEQTLSRLGLSAILAPKLVTGQNVSQTLQFVESGNAELGFVALSQVLGKAGVWVVPTDLYDPIRQDAVLLVPGQDSAAAKAFVEFLKGETALSVIKAAGYTR